MADVKQKIVMLERFRQNPDGLLPIVDAAWRVFPDKVMGKEWYDDPQVNIGWDTGLLGGNRPYFLECWATCGITILTYFVSAIGLEDASTEELVKLLTDAGLFRLFDPENPSASVMKFEDSRGNEFFSINVTVGDEEETYLEGGTIYPFGPLNEYNSRGKKEAEKNEPE